MYSIRYIWSLIEEFVGAIICIISPREISTDEEGEDIGDVGDVGDVGGGRFCNFDNF